MTASIEVYARRYEPPSGMWVADVERDRIAAEMAAEDAALELEERQRIGASFNPPERVADAELE